MACPLCTIPDREVLIYSDGLVYLVKTIKMKGHKVRVMCSIRRHTNDPTFPEKMAVFSVIYDYMNTVMGVESWYLMDSTFCTIPEHYHLVACDTISDDTQETELMNKTPKMKYPIKQKVLIGVPAHNEEKHIADIVRESKKYGDVFVLNNASTDKTEEIATSEGALVHSYSWGGYGKALQEIFKYAKQNEYKVLITIDGDGQHNPQEIPNFLSQIKKSNIVIGNRFITDSNIPFHRRVVIQGLNKIYGIGDTQCGFRAYDKTAINELNLTEDGMEASLEILNRAKENCLTISEVPCIITYDEPEKPIHKVIYQGMVLIEIMFWGAVWGKPYTFLGIPALILLLTSVFTGIWTLSLYLTTYRLIPSLALICGISFISALTLATITFIITMQRRLLKELGVRS